MIIDFERWMYDMERDCLEFDHTGELTYHFEQTKACFNRFHDEYYTAKNKGSKTACRSLIIDFCKLLPAFTAMKWQIELERSSVETLLWSSLYYCMSEQDWQDFYFKPQVNLCNDKYRIDFGVFSQADHGVLLAVTCDAFSCRYPNSELSAVEMNRYGEDEPSDDDAGSDAGEKARGKRNKTADDNRDDLEVIAITDTDIYKNPVTEAEKILNYIRSKYFDRPSVWDYSTGTYPGI